MALVLCGCPSSDPSTGKSNPGKEVNNSNQVSTRQCAEQFENSFQLMLPESLGLESDMKIAILLVNEWYNGCGKKLATVDNPGKLKEQFSQFLKPEIIARLESENFDTRDVSHIRTSILCREIVEHATKNDRTDLNRAKTLFAYATRNISIAPNVADRVPRTLFEVLLFGLGSYEDRVWFFANLMRQLRIDVIAIQPGGDNPDATILAGVILDGNVYLFNPITGFAVESESNKSAKIEESAPATLKDLINGGGVAVDGFDITNKSFAVKIIGNTSLWVSRMSAVQEQFVGEKDFVVFQHFPDDSSNSGIYGRVKKQFDKNLTGQLSIWEYPENRIRQFENPSEQEQAIISVMMAPFRTTSTTTRTNIGQNENDNQQTSREEQQFRMARLAQLQGHYDEALPAYFKIRLDHSRKISASLGSENPGIKLSRVIAEDSHYWTGLSQYEKGKYDQAINTLSTYIKKFDNRKLGNENSIFRWGNSAITLLAHSLAKQGKYSEALKALEKMPDADPESARTQALRTLWTSQTKQDSSDSES